MRIRRHPDRIPQREVKIIPCMRRYCRVDWGAIGAQRAALLALATRAEVRGIRQYKAAPAIGRAASREWRRAFISNTRYDFRIRAARSGDASNPEIVELLP